MTIVEGTVHVDVDDDEKDRTVRGRNGGDDWTREESDPAKEARVML